MRRGRIYFDCNADVRSVSLTDILLFESTKMIDSLRLHYGYLLLLKFCKDEAYNAHEK